MPCLPDASGRTFSYRHDVQTPSDPSYTWIVHILTYSMSGRRGECGDDCNWLCVSSGVIGNACCSAIGHDGAIQIAVKAIPRELEESIDGGTSHRVASLLVGGGLYTGPYFDPYTTADISVQVGSNAVLPCRVRQAGNRSVSLGAPHLYPIARS